MNMPRWPYTVMCVLICVGVFVRAGGNSEPKWSNQVEASLLVASRERKMFDGKVYFDRAENKLAAELWELKEGTTLGGKLLLIYRFDEEARMSITGHRCDVGPDIEGAEKSVSFLEDKGEKGKKQLKDFGSLFLFDPLLAQQVPFDWKTSFSVETTKWDSALVDAEVFNFQHCNLSHYITSANSESEDTEVFSSLQKIEGLCTAEGDNGPSVMEIGIHFHWSINSISNAEVFQQPPGVYCPFVNTTRSFPSLTPYFSFDFMTFDFDMEMGDNISLMNFREQIWYDSSSKLLRKDNLDWKFGVKLTMIGDYNSRLSYIIKPSGECTINELKESDTMESGITLPGENFPLFPGSKEYSPQYVGQRKRNGMTFDVWVNRKRKEEMIEVSDYYFTRNVRSEDNRNLTFPSFIEVFMLSAEDELVGSAFQPVGQYRTEPGVEDQSTFDVTNCFSESNKTRFFLKFEGDVASINQKGLREKVRNNLLSSLNIDRMRLGAVEITFIDESSIVFSSSVVEDPKRLGYKQGTEGPSREQALKSLSSLISDKKLTISVGLTDPPSALVTLTATNLSFPFSDEDTKDSKPDKEPDKGKKGGFTGGALAGVGIAMLVVGMFQGIILLVAYIRYRRNDPLVRKLTASEGTSVNS